MRYLSLFALLSLFLFSTAGFAGEGESYPDDAGSGDSTGGTVSTPPSGGGEGGGAGGSTMDQMGRSFDPKDKGGDGDPMKDLLKRDSKSSKDLMGGKKGEQLSKLEKQMQADKENVHRVKDQFGDVMRDLQQARDKVDKLGRDMEGVDRSRAGYSEKIRDLVKELKSAVREEIKAERRVDEMDQKFQDSIDKFGESSDRYEAAKAGRGATSSDAQTAPPPKVWR